jgi:hypothetical protein
MMGMMMMKSALKLLAMSVIVSCLIAADGHPSMALATNALTADKTVQILSKTVQEITSQATIDIESQLLRDFKIQFMRARLTQKLNYMPHK